MRAKVQNLLLLCLVMKKQAVGKGKYRLSYWEQQTFFQDIDVAVIGSGMVGLSAAIHLKEKHPFLKVVIIERGPLPIGASTRNAGFACFGSISELLADIELSSEEEVMHIVEKRWRGLQNLRRKYGDERIRYEHHGGYELFRPSEEKTYAKVRAAIPYFNRLLRPLTGMEATFLPAQHKIEAFGFGGIQHLILNQAEGQLNTGLLMQAMLGHAKGLGVEIYNGIKVKKLVPAKSGVTIRTKQSWQINARKVIIATNGFAKILLPKLGVLPARNQVLLTEPIPELSVKGTFHYDHGYYYFRNIDGRILLGGGRNLAREKESTYEFGTTPLIRAALIRILEKHILPGKKFKVESWWSGIMGLGQDKMPIIRRVEDNIFVAAKLGGMGVAIGNLVGADVAELTLLEL